MEDVDLVEAVQRSLNGKTVREGSLRMSHCAGWLRDYATRPPVRRRFGIRYGFWRLRRRSLVGHVSCISMSGVARWA